MSQGRPFRGVLCLAIATSAAFAAGCGVPAMDPTTSLGKAAIYEGVNQALDSSDCTTAYNLIYPVYNSGNSDNTARMLMASTYACYAGFSFFGFANNMMKFTPSAGAGGSLFSLITLEYYSPPSPPFPNNKWMEYLQMSVRAAAATIPQGTVVIPADELTDDPNNIGSILPSDRSSDANLFTLLTSLAWIGSIQSRYGNASSTTGAPQAGGALESQTTAATVVASGCLYASALVNFADAVGATAAIAQTGYLSSLFSQFQQMQTAIYAACNAGCTTAALTGCNISGGCSGCPTTLRNWVVNQCTGVATDPNSCAAAGLVDAVIAPPVFNGVWQ